MSSKSTLKCDFHYEPIVGVCSEEKCPNKSRWLCNECLFEHNNCQSRYKLNIFNQLVDYVFNTSRKGQGFYKKYSRIQKYLRERIEDFVDQCLQRMLELELGFISAQIGQKDDLQKAQAFLNIIESQKQNVKMKEEDLFETIKLIKEKENFELKQIKNIDQFLGQQELRFDKNIHQIYEELNLSAKDFDINKILNQAKQTLNSFNDSNLGDDLFNKLQNTKPVKQLIGHSRHPIVAVCDFETHIISGTVDGDVIGWAKPNYSQAFRIRCKQPLYSVCVLKAHHANYLMTAGLGPIHVYNMATQVKLYSMSGHKDKINKMLTHNGLLITASNDQTVQFWDVYNKQNVQIINKHQGPVSDITIVGKYVISVGLDGSVNVIDPQDGSQKKHFTNNHPIHSVASISNGEFLIGTSNGMIKLIHLNHGDKNLDMTVSKAVIYKIVSLSPKHILSLSSDGYLNLMRTDQLQKLKHIKIHEPGQQQDLAYNQGRLLICENGLINIFLK